MEKSELRSTYLPPFSEVVAIEAKTVIAASPYEATLEDYEAIDLFA